MSRRIRLLITLGLAAGLLLLILIWRVSREGEQSNPSPLSPLEGRPALPVPSLGSPLKATSPSPESHAPQPSKAVESPLPIPPTGTPPVNVATVEAMRASHPTATLPAPSGPRWPYISPDTWRRWALWIFAAAGLLAYIGLRLRRG